MYEEQQNMLQAGESVERKLQNTEGVMVLFKCGCMHAFVSAHLTS